MPGMVPFVLLSVTSAQAGETCPSFTGSVRR
jgi:hypothetical protein